MTSNPQLTHVPSVIYEIVPKTHTFIKAIKPKIIFNRYTCATIKIAVRSFPKKIPQIQVYIKLINGKKV